MNERHRPDIKDQTPLEVWHITAECRSDDREYRAWMAAVHELLRVYFAQLALHPEDTFSLALYRTTRGQAQVGVFVKEKT